MFHSARLKLTAWYLLIIMVVSILFSALIYNMLIQEVERFERAQRFRLEHGLGLEMVMQTPNGQQSFFAPPQVGIELIEESKHRILSVLMLINGGIFLVAGGLGYFLAGRTLKPIKLMIDEQNRFVSDASHELRTPITSLKTAFEVYLRDKNATLPEAKELIRDSVEDVDRLQTLSDSLLHLTQFEKSDTTSPVEEFSLVKTVESAVRKTKHLAKAKKITVTLSKSGGTILGNQEDITELFVILIDNAIKYSNPQLNVKITMKSIGKAATVTIADEGCGIDAKDLPYIFDRFYRTDSARSTQNHNGFGLGLSIAQTIIARHNGTISATSSLKKGSVFTITLPLHKNK